MKKIVKQVGLFTAVLITINGILGSGVFQLPRNLYLQMASNFWVAIIISSIGASLLSFGFAFLAKLINNRNGGKYIYAKEAFGNKLGGWVGLVNVFAMFIVNAGVINGFLKVVSQYSYHSGSIDWYNSGGAWYWMKISLVISIVFLIGFLLLRGVKTSKVANNIITVLKLIPLIIFLFIGLAFMNHTENFHYSLADLKNKASTLPDVSSKDIYGPIIGGVTGIVTIFYAYLGFDSVANSISIFKNPGKTVPIALGITIVLLTIIYVVVFVGVVGTLPLNELLKTGVNPLAEAVQLTPLKTTGYHIVMIGQLCSTLGISFIALFYTPYLFGAMARDGFLPSIFRAKNSRGAYLPGIILTMMGTVLFALFKFTFLVQINVLTRFIIFDMTMLALLIIIKKKGLEITKKLRAAKVLIISAIIFCTGILILKVLPFEAFINKDFSIEAFKPVTDGLTSVGLAGILFLIAWFFQWKFAEMEENKEFKKITTFITKDLQKKLDVLKIANSKKSSIEKLLKSVLTQRKEVSKAITSITISDIFYDDYNHEVTFKTKWTFVAEKKSYKKTQWWTRIKLT